jgi:hypothetical protein
MRWAIALLLLLSGNVMADWKMPADARAWRLVTAPAGGATQPSRLEGRPTEAAAGEGKIDDCLAELVDTSVVFRVKGDSPNLQSAKWQLELPRDEKPVQFVSLRYQSSGIDRAYTKIHVLTIDGVDADGKSVTVSPIDDPNLINDENWHVLTIKLEKAISPVKLSLQLGTTDSQLHFAIRELVLHESLSAAIDGFDRQNDWKQNKLSKESFHAIDLTGRLNTSADAHFADVLSRRGMVCDGGLNFRDTYVCVAGVPFHLGEPALNLHYPGETPVSPGKVFFFGEMVDRTSLMPEMRDDTIPLEVGRRTSELYLLLVNDFPVSTSQYGLPDAPYEITDVDAFRVELIYDNGERDVVFPYSIADSGFIVRRMCGAYVVPCDRARTLQRAVIHNCISGKTVGLMSATLNLGESRLFPMIAEDLANPAIPVLSEPSDAPPTARFQNNTLLMQNQNYAVEFDCASGFSVKTIHHRAVGREEIRLSPDSGLQVRVGDRTFTGRDFENKGVSTNGSSAVAQLRCRIADCPLNLELRLSAADPRQLVVGGTVTNTGKTPVQASLTFPYLKSLTIGETAQNWIYFPQYRAVLTDRDGTFRAPNDRAFAVQFFDFFNPRVGVGISLMTQNTEGVPLDYCARKDASGLTGGILHPDRYWPLEPGASRTLVNTALVFHIGDWHEALHVYRDWFGKAIPRIDASARQWFKNVWLFRSQVVSDPEARGINRTPGILDRKSGKYRIDEAFRLDEIYYGLIPHAFHFYNWFYDEKLGEEVWGDYSTDSYNNAGGLELLRSTIDDLQTKRKIPASLYLIPDRCSKASEFGRKHGLKIVARGADGAITEDAKAYYVCPMVDLWRDHFVETAVRVQKETGAKILYIDVFAFYREHSCFAKDHGHPVPMAINPGSRDLLKKLRDKLPADVALYSEYPCTDLSANLNDGNLQYYNLSLEAHFVRSHDIGEKAKLMNDPVQSIGRFAFTSLKQFSFVVGLDGDDNKGTRIKPVFFNGEGILDPTWRLYPGVHGEFLRKSLHLREKYSDCFNSVAPEPLIHTLKQGVYANAFPGDGRTAYTLYNGRFTPVVGEMIELPFEAGDSYFDAWNGFMLNPSIKDGKATISLKLQPQSVGCVVRMKAK